MNIHIYCIGYTGLLCKKKNHVLGLSTRAICTDRWVWKLSPNNFHWSLSYTGLCRAMQWSRFYLVNEKRIVSSSNDNETISSLRVRRISLFIMAFPSDHWRNHTTAIIVGHVSIATPTRRRLCFTFSFLFLSSKYTVHFLRATWPVPPNRLSKYFPCSNYY